MANPSTPATFGGMPDGIEVVELDDVDVDFAIEDMVREAATQTLEATRIEPAVPEELAALELFNGVDKKELATFAPTCQSIRAIPGTVLVKPGQLNSKTYFVLEGQLRLYPQNNDKRPGAVVDVGQSTGLRSALNGQPADHSVIATEVTYAIAVDAKDADELVKRSHNFAKNYLALFAAYVRGDNCIRVGVRSQRQGYIDELTLLHNQLWLDTVYPRLLVRHRLGEKPLAVVGLAIDKLQELAKEHGVPAALRVLEAVGLWMLNETRPTDVIAIDKNRHIFAFMPDSDLETARQMATRLKFQIQTLQIQLGSAKAPQPATITASFGVAVHEKGMKEADFLNKAEALIQKSIKLGGNWLSDKLEIEKVDPT